MVLLWQNLKALGYDKVMSVMPPGSIPPKLEADLLELKKENDKKQVGRRRVHLVVG